MPHTYMRTWPASSGEKGSCSRVSELKMRKLMGIKDSVKLGFGKPPGHSKKHPLGYNLPQYKAVPKPLVEHGNASYPTC